MGAGDLNMKKSWHPLLMVNQEKVWKREKHAVEEHKKLQELKRERDQERELQELRRMQEEAGGKKRHDRVDWMYAAPAGGGEANPNDMEDYLLGKKKIDKILRGDEAQKLSAVGGQVGPSAAKPSSDQKYQALQNANTAQDLASKVREDPMLAIKKQEQLAYEALLRDPARLKQLRKQQGLEDPHGGDKERRRSERSERHRQKHESRDSINSRDDRHSRHRSHRSHRSYRQASPPPPIHSRSRSRSTSPVPRPRDRHDRDGDSPSRSYQSDCPSIRRSREDEFSSSRRRCRDELSPPRRREGDSKDDRRSHRDYDRRSTRDDSRRSVYHDEPPRRSYRNVDRRRPYNRDRSRDTCRSSKPENDHARGGLSAEEKAAKLAAMAGAAQQVQTERSAQVAHHEAEDQAELEREAEAREAARKRYGSHTTGETIRGDFLLDQQAKMTIDSSMNLSQRLGRNRGNLQRLEADT